MSLLIECGLLLARNNDDDTTGGKQFTIRRYGEYITEPRSIGVNVKMKF
tara:strand:- start:30849 stop:30995 length:147 start_codon:yes stop_codon:yes gene_type:complete